MFGAWLSLVERLLWEQNVAGSNPVAPTIEKSERILSLFLNRYAYTRCKWIGQGRGWVDPVKEAQACQIRM